MQTIKKNSRVLIISFLILSFVISFIWINQIKTSILTIPPSPTPTTPPNFEVTIPSKALLKNYVIVSVKADTSTSCNLIFIPASGETQIMDTVADDNGECVWRWKLEESYGRGSARLIFTINGMSQTHFLQILPEF